MNNTLTQPTSGRTVVIPYYPQQFQKEIHDHPARFKILVFGRRGGKTEIAENEIIKQAVSKPSIQYPYWIVAPSYRQVKAINWVRLKMLLKNDSKWKFNEQELYAEQADIGTRIELKGADNEESLLGLGLSGVVMDECKNMKRHVWSQIIRPMLADKKGWAWFISTPKGKNWFYDLFIRGKEDGKDWMSWQYPTSINEYIEAEEIEEMKKDMPERIFRQEVMAEFLSDDTGVFKGLKSCIVGKLKAPIEGRYYVMGVDLAKIEDFTVLTVLDSVTREVVAFERFNQIEWREQKLRIQALAYQYNNALCIIDSTGIGDPIIEDLQHSGLSLYYENDKPGYKFTNESKNRLIQQLMIAIEQRKITIPEIETLVDELNDYEYQLTDRGKVTYGPAEGRHDDCVISLALAVWGIRSYLHEAQVIQKLIDKQDPADRQGNGEKFSDYENSNHAYAGY